MYDRIVRIQRTKLYFAETLIALLIMGVFNILLMAESPAFEGVEPNPLWIVVLAISARYGRPGAIFSGIMTSAYFIGYYSYIYGVDIFYEDLWLIRFPFFFMLTAFLIGEIKTVFNLREDYLTSRVEELQNLNENLKRENEIIKTAHKDLSVDVATNQDTITILNDIISRLKSNNPSDIYKGVLQSFVDHLEVEECSFYELEGNILALKEKIGWKDYCRRPDSYEVGKGMIGLAAKKQMIISIKDIVLKKIDISKEDGGDILGDSVLVLPVIGMDNRLYGVASIEKMPVLRLTSSTIQTASITCELAASALNSAYVLKTLEEKQIKEKGHDIYKYHFFLKRLEEEYLRSLNYMLPLSIMAFKWPGLEKIPDKQRTAILDSIVQMIKFNLRAFDVLAGGPIADIPLILMLATTSGPQAAEFKKKIIAKIDEYDFGKILTDTNLEETILLADFNPNKMRSANDMLKIVGL